MTAKKRGAKPKKLALKKEALRKGELADGDADQAAGGLGKLTGDCQPKYTAATCATMCGCRVA